MTIFKEQTMTWKCPSGNSWTLCDDLLNQTHVVIGGTTGSGKSTFLHSVMYSALIHSPARVQFIIIDLKHVELKRYRKLPHTIMFADEPTDAVRAIEIARDLVRKRLKEMDKHDEVIYKGNDVYLVIDEMAVLMQTTKAKVLEPLSEIMRLGRATKVHVISATQNPNRSNGGGLPSVIAQNVTATIALRCRSSIEANALGCKGAEKITEHGIGYYWSPKGTDKVAIPKTDENEIQNRINYWLNARPTRR